MAKRVLATLVLCVLIVVVIHLWVRVTPDALRARIQRALPLGSDSTRIFGFLDSLKATHSGVISTDFDSDFHGKVHMVYGSITGFRRGNLLAGGVFMKFKVDDHGRLVDSRVEYQFTWL